jgi:hypothetical protein
MYSKKIPNTLQMSFDSFDDTKSRKETAEDAEEKLLGKYQQLSNLRDENIRLGHTELDTETSWSSGSLFDCQSHDLVKILSENLQSNGTLSFGHRRNRAIILIMIRYYTGHAFISYGFFKITQIYSRHSSASYKIYCLPFISLPRGRYLAPSSF